MFSNICFEGQISSGNLSHNSALDKRTLLFNWVVVSYYSEQFAGLDVPLLCVL